MNYKAGFVGLVGRPNAGKSSLLNHLLGEKVGIVTNKPQTTRRRVVGILTDDQAQVLITDAPGAIRSTSGINAFLQSELEDVIEKSDALVAILNIDEKDPKQLDQILEMTAASGKPWLAVISKADQEEHAHRILKLKNKIETYGVPSVVVSTKYKKEDVLAELLPMLKELLPDSPAPLFDPEVYTTQNMRDLAAEVIREKCFEYLHHEVPYGTAIKVIKYIENAGPIIKIYAEVVVSKEGHRAMVVGAKAQTIRKIGIEARKELEKIVDRQIYLDLHVKVRKDWMKQDNMMKDFGYVVLD
ncbi:MAG: GTPase Era [Bdellovibrionales bacterium]|nr:GTPase Era [Bdellovibrionales bacterium]